MAARKHTRALGWVNKARAALGKEPLSQMPKGRVDHIEECPVARGIGKCQAGTTSVTFHSETEARKVRLAWGTSEERHFPPNAAYPPTLWRFVRRFDRGEYPELIGD